MRGELVATVHNAVGRGSPVDSVDLYRGEKWQIPWDAIHMVVFHVVPTRDEVQRLLPHMENQAAWCLRHGPWMSKDRLRGSSGR